MPEENETQTEQQPADGAVTEDTTTVVEPDSAESDGDVEEQQGEAAQEATEARDDPFDRKQAEAKIRKANSEAANLRKRLKELEPKAAELQAIKDAEKSESERLNDQLTRANDQIVKTRQRLVRTQVQAMAGAGFADPEDAVGALDLDSYIDSEGDIDTSAIEADLQALLERKPHWAKAQPQEGPRRPAPDRTQASGANQSRATPDPADVFAGFITSKLKN